MATRENALPDTAMNAPRFARAPYRDSGTARRRALPPPSDSFLSNANQAARGNAAVRCDPPARRARA